MGKVFVPYIATEPPGAVRKRLQQMYGSGALIANRTNHTEKIQVHLWLLL